MNASRLQIDHLTLTGNAVIGLKMVLVVEPILGTFEDNRIVQGIPHPIGSDYHTRTFPAVATNVAWRVLQFLELRDDQFNLRSMRALIRFDQWRIFRRKRCVRSLTWPVKKRSLGTFSNI